MIRDYKASILVLLFNKKIHESETLTSLLSANVRLDGVQLTIWNNGPEIIDELPIDYMSSIGLKCELVQTVDNIPLSIIYNNFFKKISADRYVILDDDSCLSIDFINDILNVRKDELGLPLIFSGDTQQEPKFNGQLVTEKPKNTNFGKWFSIGTGLVVGADFLKEVKNNYVDVFDERFYFYGVDISLFHRINELGLSQNVKVLSSIQHSLSRLAVESEEVAEFRAKERAYDLALQLFFYKKPLKRVMLIGYYTLDFLYKKLRGVPGKISIYWFYRALIERKHYKF